METNYNITKEQLISTAIPEQTRTYKPVSHEQLMNLTLEALKENGFIVGEEKYTSARDGNIATGKYVIRNVADDEMCLQVAWQNSYNKSVSLKFAIGAHVFICGNGTVFGDIGAFKKKHQGEIQEFTPAAISEYIKRAGDIFAQIQNQRDVMKKVTLNLRQKAELIGRMMVEEEFLQSTQANIIIRELKFPTFNYGAPDSLWELYQFTTQAMKSLHPSLWMEQHALAHDFFVNEALIQRVNADITIPIPGSHPQGNLFDIDYTEVKEDAVGEV